MNELNRKLAKWAGFIEGDIKKHYYWETFGARVAKWQEPGKEWHIKLPNFTESFDALFEWIVPELKEIDIEFDFTFTEDEGGRMCEVTLQPFTGYGNTRVYYSARDYNPALALCLAIEKLIEVK